MRNGKLFVVIYRYCNVFLFSLPRTLQANTMEVIFELLNFSWTGWEKKLLWENTDHANARMMCCECLFNNIFFRVIDVLIATNVGWTQSKELLEFFYLWTSLRVRWSILDSFMSIQINNEESFCVGFRKYSDALVWVNSIPEDEGKVF